MVKKTSMIHDGIIFGRDRNKIYYDHINERVDKKLRKSREHHIFWPNTIFQEGK